MLVALFIILGLQLILLVVLGSFALTLFWGSPWVPTHTNKARRMLEFAEFREGESLLDLGSGDGSILFCAVEDFGAREAIGFEINPLLVIAARVRAVMRRSHGRIFSFGQKVDDRPLSDQAHGRVLTYHRNMFSAALPHVDVVATFLIPSTMKRLQEKFATELSPDTRIISRGFAIPGVTPLRKKEGPEEWLYLYRAGDLM